MDFIIYKCVLNRKVYFFVNFRKVVLSPLLIILPILEHYSVTSISSINDYIGTVSLMFKAPFTLAEIVLATWSQQVIAKTLPRHCKRPKQLCVCDWTYNVLTPQWTYRNMVATPSRPLKTTWQSSDKRSQYIDVKWRRFCNTTF